MKNQQIDIALKPIKDFLDAVDIVLNSNTFILQFNFENGDLNKSLLDFLTSETFISQMAQADIDRGWYILHDLDPQSGKYTIRKGSILEKNVILNFDTLTCDKREYLIAMLTGDTSKGNFFSFYGKQMPRSSAELIIDNLISYLTQSNDWQLHILKPDFLKDATEVYSKEGEDLSYFEGDNGNDSAIVIKCNSKGFLILTNGAA